MTVLNTPNDGSFNVLVVLFRALIDLGPTEPEELFAYCSAGLPEQPERLKHTLNRWTSFGLFRNVDGRVRLADEFKIPKSSDFAARELARFSRRLVFRQENNDRFWDSGESKSADLTRGLAWLLAQDIYKTKVGDTSAIQELEVNQLVDPTRRIVQNNVRLEALRVWGLALGFLWNADTPIIDPTAAISDDLASIFGSSDELNAEELQSRIATILPVLDGGIYRMEVESALDPASWRRPTKPELLSTALSRALWRLNDQGRLILEHRSDTGNIRVLQRANGQEWVTFSHARIARRSE